MSNQGILPGMDHPKLHGKRKARQRWDSLKEKFAEESKTESAFYLLYMNLKQEDREFLTGWFNVENEWKAFERMCRFFSVNMS